MFCNENQEGRVLNRDVHTLPAYLDRRHRYDARGTCTNRKVLGYLDSPGGSQCVTPDLSIRWSFSRGSSQGTAYSLPLCAR